MQETKLDRFTPSMIVSYMNCPLAFYYTYIAKIEIPQQQIHLLFGGGVHEAIEKGIYGKEDPYKTFDKHFIKDKLLDEEKYLHQEYCKLGNEMIKNYSEEHEMLNLLYKLNDGISEKKIRKHLLNPLTGEKTSLPMSGRLDRLTNAGKIVEYKTSKSRWKEEELRFKAQTYLYNLWYFTEYGEMPDETLYIILLKKIKKREKDQVIQVLSHNCTITDLASVFDEVELILEKINNRDFHRPTGYHPVYCDCYKYEKFLNFNQEEDYLQ